MAKKDGKSASMYEKSSDSDEDDEVYYLKPVNEYNILDKIREANKELFAELAASSDRGNSAPSKDEQNPRRRVTFAENLEEYAPDTMSESSSTVNVEASDPDESSARQSVKSMRFGEADQAISNSHERRMRAESSSSPDSAEDDGEERISAYDYALRCGIDVEACGDPGALQAYPRPKKHTTQMMPTTALIEEEDEDELLEEQLEEAEAADYILPTSAKFANIPKKMEVDAFDEEELEVFKDEDGQVDEICEEIDVMDIENDKADNIENNNLSGKERRIIKQHTFDCEEQDNKSLINLLGSDADDDPQEINNKQLLSKEDANLNELHADDDDDDNLSLIVASYLPDNFELRSPSQSSKSSTSYSNRKQYAHATAKPRRFPFTRFSFRRKHGGSSAGTTRHTHSAASTKDVKFNYKICCEHRQSEQEKLPKYTGYLSEYGLSRKQLEKREQSLEKKKQTEMDQTLKTSEQELCKMKDNERAFTSWLKNKMRFPINKTRNMFDTKGGMRGKK